MITQKRRHQQFHFSTHLFTEFSNLDGFYRTLDGPERSTIGDYHISDQRDWLPPMSLWLFGWLALLLQCDWSLSSPASPACDSSHRPVIVPLLPDVWKQLLMGKDHTPVNTKTTTSVDLSKQFILLHRPAGWDPLCNSCNNRSLVSESVVSLKYRPFIIPI